MEIVNPIFKHTHMHMTEKKTHWGVFAHVGAQWGQNPASTSSEFV